MSTKKETYESCMTVRDLKALIADWPELDETGEPSEVWISTAPASSSPVVSALHLNKTDLILECSEKAFARYRMNEQFVREAVDALMWMHYDKSIGLKPGDRFHIEGVAKLKAQWEALQKK